jgi:hypothetical protein
LTFFGFRKSTRDDHLFSTKNTPFLEQIRLAYLPWDEKKNVFFSKFFSQNCLSSEKKRGLQYSFCTNFIGLRRVDGPNLGIVYPKTGATPPSIPAIMAPCWGSRDPKSDPKILAPSHPLPLLPYNCPRFWGSQGVKMAIFGVFGHFWGVLDPFFDTFWRFFKSLRGPEGRLTQILGSFWVRSGGRSGGPNFTDFGVCG